MKYYDGYDMVTSISSYGDPASLQGIPKRISVLGTPCVIRAIAIRTTEATLHICCGIIFRFVRTILNLLTFHIGYPYELF